MDISILKKLNFSDKEIKIYLALLEHGSSSVRYLAEVTKINRGTVYDVLKKMQEEGLVVYFHQDTKQKFAVEDPDKLLHLVENKERELEKTKKQIEDIIPELKSLQGAKDDKPTSKFYEGKQGIKFILDDVLQMKKNSEYYVYSAPGVRDDLYEAYPEFTKKRIKQKIQVKTISLSEGGKTYGMDARKWLGIGKKDSQSNTFILIYDNKCAFIARDKSGKLIGVLIENEMIFITQKNIFLQLWNLI